MQGFITVKQAAERLGVSRQTVINWVNEGAIKIHNIGGKQYWLDSKSIDALQDTAQDIARQMRKLEDMRENLRLEVKKLEGITNEVKRDLSLIRKTRSYTTSLDFYLSIPRMIHKLGGLNDRELAVMQTIIKTGSLEDAAKEHNVSRERIRQIYTRAIRRCNALSGVQERLQELNDLREENSTLKGEIRALERSLAEFTRLKALTEQMDEDERIKAFMEKDSMCQIFNTRIYDLDLSVRALNCLRAADIETIGDIVSKTKLQLMHLRNFGNRSVCEIEDLLNTMGLSFGMDVDSIYRQRYELLKAEENE